MLSEQGVPLKDVAINIFSERSGNQSAVTDEDGRFRIEHLVGETENISVSKPGYGAVQFANIPTNTDRDFKLPPMHRYLGGRVIDESGKPIASVTINADISSYFLYGRRQIETTTDSLGRFWLSELVGDTVAVTVQAAGYKTLTTNQKTNVENITLLLER